MFKIKTNLILTEFSLFSELEAAVDARMVEVVLVLISLSGSLLALLLLFVYVLFELTLVTTAADVVFMIKLDPLHIRLSLEIT